MIFVRIGINQKLKEKKTLMWLEKKKAFSPSLAASWILLPDNKSNSLKVIMLLLLSCVCLQQQGYHLVNNALHEFQMDQQRSAGDSDPDSDENKPANLSNLDSVENGRMVWWFNILI